MKKLLVTLTALLLCMSFAEQMGPDAVAYPHVQNAFIKMGGVNTGCNASALDYAESACGYAEMNASLARRWIDLVLLPDSAVSAWEPIKDRENTFRKGYALDGRLLEVIVWETSETNTVLYFHHYLLK